jgi:IS30 family transposase
MSKNYTQLSLIQRYQIEVYIKVGMKQKMIAQELGLSPSTICRELSRITAKRGKLAVLIWHVTLNEEQSSDKMLNLNW